MSTSLKLRGVVSHIDQRDKAVKVVVSFDDETYPETRRILEHGIRAGNHYAFSDKEFWCAIPAYATGSAFKEFEGRRVVITAIPRHYKFISTAAHNNGELITGTQLVIDNIERILPKQLNK